MSLAALVPAFNPGEVVIDVVKKTLSEVDHVILVNDGSDARNTEILNQLDKSSADISLLSHRGNFGKGFAIQSGLNLALQMGFDHVIMLDSDGQHDPAEIQLFKDKLAERDCSFIIGTRTQINKMPLKSKIGNISMSWAFKLITGKKLIDTQSGYRLLSRSFIKTFLASCKPGRYETEMKMLFLAAKTCDSLEQVAIKTIYIDDNRNSKFKPVQDSVRVLSSFMLFAGVGVLSFLLDYGLFLVLTLWGGSYFLDAHIISRIVSSSFNYLANKRYVFNNQSSVASTAFKYLLTALASLLLSSALLYLFVDNWQWSPVWAKPSAELLTFCINFFILKNFVFAEKD